MSPKTPGYLALQEGAAWLDLSGRGKIRVTGRDRVRWLHNMISNDVKGVQPGQGNYSFVLSPQGRIQADLNLYVFADQLLLDCDAELTAKILQHLKKYIIADDVKLEDVATLMGTIAVEGPKAAEAAGIAVPVIANSHVAQEGIIAARTSATGQPGLWLFAEPARKAQWTAKLEEAGAVAATAEDFEVARVENGIPRYGADFGETTLPQEAQQGRALHFNKGCYIGQEIVERIRSRGQVHRLLVKIGIAGDRAPAAGTSIFAQDQEAGKLSSPVLSPRFGQVVGLGILRREFAAAGSKLIVEGREAAVLS